MPTAAQLGQTGVNATTVYNSRAAQANATAQDSAHIQALLSHVNTAQQNVTDPNLKASLSAMAKTIGSNAPTASGPSLSAFQTTDANKAAGLQTTYASATPTGSPINDGAIPNGTYGIAGNSADQQDVIERLRQKGLPDDQIRSIINNPDAIRQELRFTPVANGTAPGQSSTANLDQANQTISTMTGSGHSWQPGEAEKIRADAMAADKAAADKANATAAASSNASAVSSATGNKATSSDQTVNDLNTNLDQQKTDNANNLATQINGGTVDVNGQKVQVQGINDTFNAADASLQNQAQKDQAYEKQIQDNLDRQHELDIKTLDDQKQQAQNDLAYQESQDILKNSNDEAKAIDSEIAKICLTGQVGSSGAYAELAETKQNFNKNLLDIQQKFRNDSSSLITKFAGLYQQSSADYTTSSNNNIQKLVDELTVIEGQQRTTDDARATAMRSALDTFTKANADAVKEYNTAIQAHNKEMATVVADKVKADALLKAQTEENKIKREAINASTQNRNTAATASAGVHADAVASQDRTAVNTFLTSATTELQAKDNPVNVYNQIYQQNNQFNSGYDLATAKNATAGDRAAGTVQALLQFSHGQAPGSIRVTDLAATEAMAGQSLSDKAAAEITHWTQGGPPLSRDTLDAMKSLMHTAEQNQRQAGFQALLPIWQRAQMTNGTLSPASPLQIAPSAFITNPVLLQMVRQKQDDDLSNQLDTNNPFGSPSGSFSPSDKMTGGVQAMIGTRNVTAAPAMMTALQSADQAMFAATGQHLQINSDYRSTAQQQQAYNDYLSGKIALAAPPGQSLHEKGLAADVTNWKEAEPYLVAAGLSPLGPVGSSIRSSDPAHFELRGQSEGTTVAANNSPDTFSSDSLLAMAMEPSPYQQ